MKYILDKNIWSYFGPFNFKSPAVVILWDFDFAAMFMKVDTTLKSGLIWMYFELYTSFCVIKSICFFPYIGNGRKVKVTKGRASIFVLQQLLQNFAPNKFKFDSTIDFEYWHFWLDSRFDQIYYFLDFPSKYWNTLSLIHQFVL